MQAAFDKEIPCEYMHLFAEVSLGAPLLLFATLSLGVPLLLLSSALLSCYARHHALWCAPAAAKHRGQAQLADHDTWRYDLQGMCNWQWERPARLWAPSPSARHHSWWRVRCRLL